MKFCSFLKGIEDRFSATAKTQKEIVDLIGFNKTAISYFTRASELYANPSLQEVIGITERKLFFGDDVAFSNVFEKWDKLSKYKKDFLSAMVNVLVDGL